MSDEIEEYFEDELNGKIRGKNLRYEFKLQIVKTNLKDKFELQI